MSLAWIAVEQRTGEVITELPDLAFDWPMRRSIGRAEAATAHLPLSTAPAGWRWATREGSAALIAVERDDDIPGDQGIPVWGGLVQKSDIVRTVNTWQVDITLATAEGYLDRRYVGDVSYTNVGQNLIVADLVAKFATDTPTSPGLPFTVVQSTAGGGTLRTRTYADQDDASVLTRLQQLSAVLGGPEWVVEWLWSADLGHIRPTLYVGDRVGQATPAGVAPSATYSMPGSVIEAHRIRDYSSGKGANDAMAVSSGQGDIRPQSRVRSTNFAGRPTYEIRWTPSTSITDPATLAGYATSALNILGDGQQAVTMTAQVDAYPQIGRDVMLGDDVAYDLEGLGDDLGVFSGVGRVIAFERSEAQMTPILAVQELDTGSDG